MQPPGCRVEGGEESVLGANAGTRQGVQERGLTGVGVADDGDRLELGAAPARALLLALALDVADLLFQVPQPAPDAPPLDLDLLLAGTAAGTDPAALAVVVPGADEARQ